MKNASGLFKFHVCLRTLFKQEGIIEMVGFGRMSWVIEMFASKFLTRGARNNVHLMEELIKERLASFNM